MANKLAYLFIASALVIGNSFALSLGDKLDTQVAMTTSLQHTSLTEETSKYIVYRSISANSTTQYKVNRSTHKIYGINWKNKEAMPIKDILGSYYPEFKKSWQNRSNKFNHRYLYINDGDLYIEQFGSILSGFQGMATVKSLAPQ